MRYIQPKYNINCLVNKVGGWVRGLLEVRSFPNMASTPPFTIREPTRGGGEEYCAKFKSSH